MSAFVPNPPPCQTMCATDVIPSTKSRTCDNNNKTNNNSKKKKKEKKKKIMMTMMIMMKNNNNTDNNNFKNKNNNNYNYNNSIGVFFCAYNAAQSAEQYKDHGTQHSVHRDREHYQFNKQLTHDKLHTPARVKT